MHPDFDLVNRQSGSAWLHKSAPVWVVCYEGIPGSMTHRYDSWQAYKAVDDVPVGRDPWTVNNKRLGSEMGWATPEQAFRAASDAASELLPR